MNRLDLARQLDYIREASENAGLRVEAIQKWCDGEKGDSWCCEFATMVLDIEFKGNAPIPRLRACQDVYALAQKNGWVLDAPELGCLVLTVNADDHAHHIGICSSITPLKTIAGNTSADGVSVNGDRVAEHEISLNGKVFVRVVANG